MGGLGASLRRGAGGAGDGLSAAGLRPARDQGRPAARARAAGSLRGNLRDAGRLVSLQPRLGLLLLPRPQLGLLRLSVRRPCGNAVVPLAVSRDFGSLGRRLRAVPAVRVLREFFFF